MNIKSFGRRIYFRWLLILMLWGVSLVGFSASASTTGLSITNFPIIEWKKMFDHSMSRFDIINQCRRIVAHDQLYLIKKDRVTSSECVELGEMFFAKKCSVSLIPDGVLLVRLTGIVKGKPSVLFNRQKQLGRSDQATMCTLANGKKFVFFNIGRDADGNKIERCFNLGLIMPPKIEPAKNEVTGYWSCREVLNSSVVAPTENFYLPSADLSNCNDGNFAQSVHVQQVSTLQAQGSSEDCHWVSIVNKIEEKSNENQ